MKKLFFILLTGIMTASLAGCGKGKEAGSKPEYTPLIREDLMWNTEELFNRAVTVEKGETGDYANANGTTEAIFYDGPEYNGKPTKVFAYVGFPSAPMPEGGYPAVILVHGGGGCAFFEWVEYWNGKGYAAIAPDFYAQQYGSYKLQNGKAPKNPDGGPVDSGSFRNTAEDYKDSWVYHSVYNIISAHNILLSDERVNENKTGLTGISWGSVLTCIAAGVDYRFGAFAPVYGTGFLLETPGVSSRDYFEMPYDAAEWMRYYDPASYLTYCNRPIMFSIGTNDSFFSPVLQQQSADLCEGPVYHCFRAELRHYHRWKDEEGMIHVADFMDFVLSGKAAPFVVESEALDGRELTVTLSDGSSVKQIRVCYTLSTEGNSTQWKWSLFGVNPKEFDGNKLTVTLPENAEYCFFEFSDGAFDEYFQSTRLYSLEK